MFDLRQLRKDYKIRQEDLAKALNVKQPFVSQVERGIDPMPEDWITILQTVYQINEITKYTKQEIVSQKTEIISYIPLLPISAIGSPLNDFVMAVKDYDCEKITSPIKGCDFAITVTGHSMEPEYPAGSQILIKKIQEEQFIEWGRCYVLDTCNGIVVKKLIKGENGAFHCVSTNPDQVKYAPFDVPADAVNGVYRVLMVMSMK